MSTARLNAFFDAVTAIIITIMVLDLKPPTGSTFSDLLDVGGNFLVYILSFLSIAVYWNNHHHIMSLVNKVTTRFLWINILILFLFSLIPFATSWIASTDFAAQPIALYGIISLCIFLSLSFLLHTVENATFGKNSILLRKERRREKLTIVRQIIAIILALVFNLPILSFVIFIINLFIVRNPPKVIESFHDMMNDGIDVINDEDAQFNALVSENDKRRLIARLERMNYSKEDIEELRVLFDNNDIRGLAEYRDSKAVKYNQKVK